MERTLRSSWGFISTTRQLVFSCSKSPNSGSRHDTKDEFDATLHRSVSGPDEYRTTLSGRTVATKFDSSARRPIQPRSAPDARLNASNDWADHVKSFAGYCEGYCLRLGDIACCGCNGERGLADGLVAATATARHQTRCSQHSCTCQHHEGA